MKIMKNLVILGLLFASIPSMLPMIRYYKDEIPDDPADDLILEFLQSRTKEVPSLASLCMKALLKKGLTPEEWEKLSKIDFSDPKVEEKLFNSYVHKHAVFLENIRDKEGKLLLKELSGCAPRREKIRQYLGDIEHKMTARFKCGMGNIIGVCADDKKVLITKKGDYEHPSDWRMPEVKYAYVRDAAKKTNCVSNLPLIARSHNPKGFMVVYDDMASQSYIIKNNDLDSKIALDKKFKCVPWYWWGGDWGYKTNSAWISDDDKYIVINMVDLGLDKIVQDKRFCAHYGKKLGVFDSKTGKCLHELSANDYIFASLCSKDSSLLAAFTATKVIIWNPYTGEKKGEFAHPFYDKNIYFGRILEMLTSANKENNHWRLWCEFLNDKELALSWSTDSWNDLATQKFIGLYMYDIASGKLLSKTEGWDTGVPYPIYKLVRRCLSLPALMALITLEKQYNEKAQCDEASWKMLYNSGLEPLRNLTQSRYLLPEHRPDADDVLNKLGCLSGDSKTSAEHADEYEHDEDSLCTTQ
jgi:hypothetical protein